MCEEHCNVFLTVFPQALSWQNLAWPCYSRKRCILTLLPSPEGGLRGSVSAIRTHVQISTCCSSTMLQKCPRNTIRLSTDAPAFGLFLQSPNSPQVVVRQFHTSCSHVHDHCQQALRFCSSVFGLGLSCAKACMMTSTQRIPYHHIHSMTPRASQKIAGGTYYPVIQALIDSEQRCPCAPAPGTVAFTVAAEVVGNAADHAAIHASVVYCWRCFDDNPLHGLDNRYAW